jgi:hypothetical protein
MVENHFNININEKECEIITNLLNIKICLNLYYIFISI